MQGEEECKAFFGKYRGTVENPVDLQGLGRVQVSVPDVLGKGKSSWAMPAAPYAGAGVAFFAIPPKGTSVWVEFERGDPDWPVWSGCFWNQGQEPAGKGPTNVQKTIFRTPKASLTITDEQAIASFVLEIQVGGAAGTAKIEASSGGLTISCAGSTIALGPEGVAINGSHLKVLK